MRKIIHYFGIVLFIIGICSADSEKLIYPIIMVVFGLIIAYTTRGDYYDDYGKYD